MFARWLHLLALALAGGCSGAAAFPCDAASQCIDAGVAGVCQSDGWCSFPDGGCDSGQRYGAHAGEDLAGLCVDDAGTTGAIDPETDAGAESVDPSLATLEGTGPVGEAEAEVTGSVDAGTTADATADATTAPASEGEVGGGVEAEADAGSGAEAGESGVEPECGNGIIDGTEQCDGMDLGGQDCDSLDAGVGVPACDAMCEYDVSTCEPDTGGYDPCEDDTDCPDAICHVFAGNGTCLPHCDVDDDCAQPSGAEDPVCTIDRFCVLPCLDDGDCPELMRCDASPYGMVCLF